MTQRSLKLDFNGYHSDVVALPNIADCSARFSVGTKSAMYRLFTARFPPIPTSSLPSLDIELLGAVAVRTDKEHPWGLGVVGRGVEQVTRYEDKRAEKQRCLEVAESPRDWTEYTSRNLTCCSIRNMRQTRTETQRESPRAKHPTGSLSAPQRPHTRRRWE